MESDSAGVVEAINESYCNGEFGMVIQGSLELLRSFGSWFVRYLKRDYNRAAHELAQLAKVAGSSQQCRGVESPMLQHVLLLDRAKIRCCICLFFSLLVDVLCCTPVSVLMNCQFQFQKKKKMVRD